MNDQFVFFQESRVLDPYTPIYHPRLLLQLMDCTPLSWECQSGEVAIPPCWGKVDAFINAAFFSRLLTVTFPCPLPPLSFTLLPLLSPFFRPIASSSSSPPSFPPKKKRMNQQSSSDKELFIYMLINALFYYSPGVFSVWLDQNVTCLIGICLQFILPACNTLPGMTCSKRLDNETPNVLL